MADNLTRIYELQVKLAQASLQQLRALTQLAKAASSSLGELNDMAKNLAGNLGGAFTAGAFIASVKGALEAVDQLNATAERAGIAVEEMSKLAYAAGQANTDVGELATGLKELQGSMVEASKEGSKANKIFTALGVDPSGKGATEVLKDLASQFQNIEDPALRTKVAVDLFGKSGQALIPFLMKGGEEIERLMKRFEDMGLVVSEDAAKKVDEFSNSMKDLRAVQQKTYQDIGVGLAPALTQLANAFVDAKKNGADFKELGEGLGVVFKGVAIVAYGFYSALTLIGKAIAAISTINAPEDIPRALEEWKRDAEDVAAAQTAFNDALMKTPPAATEAAKSTAKATVDQVKLRDAAAGTKEQMEKEEKALAAFARRLGQLQEALLKSHAPQEQMSEYAKILREIERGELKVTAAQKERLLVTAQQLDKQKELTKALQTQQDIDEALVRAQRARTQRLYGDTPTAQIEKIRTQMSEIEDDLLSFEEQSPEQIAKMQEAYAGLQDKLKQLTEKTLPKQKDMWDELRASIEGWSRDATDAVLDFALGAESNIGKMVENVLRQFARLAIQRQIFDPLFKQFGQMIPGGTPTVGGGGGVGELTAQGAAFNAGGNILPFARGGVVRRPTLFRFASGTGLMGEAGPEGILPLARTASGELGVKTQGAGTVVNINNYSSEPAKVERTRGANGQEEINVMIGQAVENHFTSGKMDRIMSTTYGARRQGH